MDQFLHSVELPHGSEKPKLTTVRSTGLLDITPTELFVRGTGVWNMIKEYSEVSLLLQDLGPRPWMNLTRSIDEAFPFMQETKGEVKLTRVHHRMHPNSTLCLAQASCSEILARAAVSMGPKLVLSIYRSLGTFIGLCSSTSSGENLAAMCSK